MEFLFALLRRKIYDSKIITADYLIENIDLSFEVWKNIHGTNISLSMTFASLYSLTG